ncbi:MAG: hypothetical protein PHW62_06625, partial [Candidatus Ratteibacteria bacterium]|nr:hypothetical protein [Candidatus Ratteibacteria bacterium]
QINFATGNSTSMLAVTQVIHSKFLSVYIYIWLDPVRDRSPFVDRTYHLKIRIISNGVDPV